MNSFYTLDDMTGELVLLYTDTEPAPDGRLVGLEGLGWETDSPRSDMLVGYDAIGEDDIFAYAIDQGFARAEIALHIIPEYNAGGGDLASTPVSFSSAEKQYLRSSLFDLARNRSAWTYRVEPMKWAAMVVSETTRQLYGRSNAVDKYMQSCFGFFRMMLEYHLPVDIITEADLAAGLAVGYKVLILPNTACLSSASVSAIQSFVAAGGGLVATGATPRDPQLSLF